MGVARARLWAWRRCGYGRGESVVMGVAKVRLWAWRVCFMGVMSVRLWVGGVTFMGVWRVMWAGRGCGYGRSDDVGKVRNY